MRVLAALVVVMLIPTGLAQADGFLRLGEDPRGDALIQGQSHPDTMVDILYLDVATAGTDLVFDLGLAGTTTEAGSYCPVVAFQRGSTEYLAFDCFECVAYQCSAAASGANPPASSRGTNVASKVELLADTARITVPLSAIGASLGDTISDIYALTYQTRALVVADAAPNAKSSAGAVESFGEYVLGLGRPTVVDDLPELPASPAVVHEQVNDTLLHRFGNATSGTYLVNVTGGLANATVQFAWNATQGTVNATLSDANGTVLLVQSMESSGNLSVESLGVVPGTWSLNLTYSSFIGELSFQVLSWEEGVGLGGTEDPTVAPGAGEAEAPAPWLAAVAALGAAAWSRRRR